MSRFIPSLLTIGFGLGFGFLIGMLDRKYGKSDSLLPLLCARAQKFCLLIINPIVFVGAVWVLPINNGAFVLLPFVGLAALSSGLLVGWLAMRLRPLPAAGQRIGFTISCSFTNIGNIGGLVVFLLLGELGYSLIPFYKLFEEFWYYSVLFPYARQQATAEGLYRDTRRPHHTRLRTLRDPFFVVIAFAILLGLTFNLFGVVRPPIYGELNALLIPTSSLLLLSSIGSQLRIGKIPEYWKPAATVFVLRMVTIPVVAIGAAYLFGIGGADPVVIRTVVVLAVMPIGFTCLVPANIYNLDSDLVNTAWMLSTASLLFTVPLLSILFS